jgi:hypothetical protein
MVEARAKLASFKLNAREVRVRIVPAQDARGCPFEGPGVDLVGEAARQAIAHAAPIRRWLESREPGVVLRSVSIDLRSRRVLVTIEGGPKPRVLRIDAPASAELVDCARPLVEHLERAAAAALARRR